MIKVLSRQSSRKRTTLNEQVELKIALSKALLLLTSEYGRVDFLHGLLNKMYYIERNAIQVNE